MLSNTSRYAIRALIYLAIKTEGSKKIGIKKIADDLEIPSPFLGKILQTLAKQKVLNSTKGPNGGFNMPEELQQITLYQVIKIIDGEDLFDKCLVANKSCNELDGKPCSLHSHYATIREDIKVMFSGHTIAQLAEEFRLSDGGIHL